MQTQPLTSAPAALLLRSQGQHQCDDPIACDRCLRAVARFLAYEMGYNAEAARIAPAEWYRKDLGEDVLTIERARELRFMTILFCMGVTAGTVQPGTVVPFPAPPKPLPRWVPVGRMVYRWLAHPFDRAVEALEGLDPRMRFEVCVVLGCVVVLALVLFGGHK